MSAPIANEQRYCMTHRTQSTNRFTVLAQTTSIPAPIYNTAMPIPAEIRGQRYISLATFRKTGVPVYTPVWFAEEGDKIYVMTNAKLAKVKRIRNNPQVKIAPCTIRGKITGPEFSATARILSAEDAARPRRAIKDKYWLARLPWLWRNSNTYIEITVR